MKRQQSFNYENIHFHLVDLKNTINDTKYSKNDYISALDRLIEFIDRILREVK